MLLTSPVRAHPGHASWLHFEEIVHALGDLARKPVRIALAVVEAVAQR